MNSFSWGEKPPLILITDDDRMMRILIRQAMERQGYQVLEASNGQECVETYQSQSPDLVLLDALMPVMDGFTCCRELQMLSHQKALDFYWDNHKQEAAEKVIHENNNILTIIDRIPILMITGLNDTDSVNRAFEVGATDYITKPINWAVLQQRVRRLLQQSRLYQQLEAAHYQLQRLATLDSLTQLANRRRFEEYLRQQWNLMLREQHPLSLILCDLDFFKYYNDTYGHQAGDNCLQQVAAAISYEAKRPSDLVARYGGEELVLILPNTDSYGAMNVAKRIREQVSELKIQHLTSTVNDYVTLSLGIACVVPQLNLLPADLIEAADKALYQAKHEGRDRAIVYTF